MDCSTLLSIFCAEYDWEIWTILLQAPNCFLWTQILIWEHGVIPKDRSQSNFVWIMGTEYGYGSTGFQLYSLHLLSAMAVWKPCICSFSQTMAPSFICQAIRSIKLSGLHIEGPQIHIQDRNEILNSLNIHGILWLKAGHPRPAITKKKLMHYSGILMSEYEGMVSVIIWSDDWACPALAVSISKVLQMLLSTPSILPFCYSHVAIVVHNFPLWIHGISYTKWCLVSFLNVSYRLQIPMHHFLSLLLIIIYVVLFCWSPTFLCLFVCFFLNQWRMLLFNFLL